MSMQGKEALAGFGMADEATEEARPGRFELQRRRAQGDDRWATVARFDSEQQAKDRLEDLVRNEGVDRDELRVRHAADE